MIGTMQSPSSTNLRSLTSVYPRERKLSSVMASSSATVTRTDTSHQATTRLQLSLNTTYKPIFQELAPVSRKPETLSDHDLDKEVGVLVERLKAVVAKVAEHEMKRFTERVKAEGLSEEDRAAAEEMKEEIVRQYVEKPIRSLQSGCKVNLEQKMKDLRFLLNMLEESSSSL